ncbi:hypothetical protein PsorP6_010423 [Peronosclerospora sorghi]|uniref:Uncharacterized protein n=1 Tax=Peronosclerospora sorghi TaxID=230839 RepID=A0ACC0VY04_9STRA|nr:hypothetical protein PsorP6_010423 [Peronosclerospora sorghi]
MAALRLFPLVSLCAATLVVADISISVQHDATYLLSDSHGVPCSGHGVEPAGTCCPKAGDIAATDCQTYLPSYNGSMCVAPEDAHCVVVTDGTWGCVFPHMKYDKTLEKPLHINCDVASDEPMTHGGGDMTLETHDAMSGKTTAHVAPAAGYDHPSTVETSVEPATTSSKETYATTQGATPFASDDSYHPLTTEAESDKTYQGHSVPTAHISHGGPNMETTSENGTVEEAGAPTSHGMMGDMTGTYETGDGAGYDKGTTEPYKPEHVGYDTTASYKGDGYDSPTQTANPVKDTPATYTEGYAVHEAVDSYPVKDAHLTEETFHEQNGQGAYLSSSYHTEKPYDSVEPKDSTMTSSPPYPAEVPAHSAQLPSATPKPYNDPSQSSGMETTASYNGDGYVSQPQTADPVKDTPKDTPATYSESYAVHEAVDHYSINDTYSATETFQEQDGNGAYLSNDSSISYQTEKPYDTVEPKDNNTMTSSPPYPAELPAPSAQLPSATTTTPYNDTTTLYNDPIQASGMETTASYNGDGYDSQSQTPDPVKDTPATYTENEAAHEAVDNYSINDTYSTEETSPAQIGHGGYSSIESPNTHQAEESYHSVEPIDSTMTSYPPYAAEVPAHSAPPPSSGLVSNLLGNVLPEVNAALTVSNEPAHSAPASSSGLVSNLLGNVLPEVNAALTVSDEPAHSAPASSSGLVSNLLGNVLPEANGGLSIGAGLNLF